MCFHMEGNAYVNENYTGDVMQFIHKSTRLSCDLGRAFRFLTNSDMIKKWSGYEAHIELKQDGEFTLQSDNGLDTKGSIILKYEREKVLQVKWKDSFNAEETYDLTVQFMPCKSDTEYCSELHLMFKNLNRALKDDEAEFYNTYFETFFETLRVYQNKDWVIQDSDLSMSYLVGSKL